MTLAIPVYYGHMHITDFGGCFLLGSIQVYLILAATLDIEVCESAQPY